MVWMDIDAAFLAAHALHQEVAFPIDRAETLLFHEQKPVGERGHRLGVAVVGGEDMDLLEQRGVL